MRAFQRPGQFRGNALQTHADGYVCGAMPWEKLDVDEYTVTLMDDGRVVVPAEMRRRLGLRSGDKLIFTIVGNEIRVQCPHIALEAVLGSIEPLPGTTTDDIERQIDQASEAAARRRYARMVSHPSSPD